MKPALLIFLASLCSGVDVQRSGLFGRFGSWYDLPRTVQALENHVDKYVGIGHLDYLNVDMYSLPKDPRIILLYDQKGNIGGIRYGLIKEDIALRAESKNLTLDLKKYEDRVGIFFQDCNHWGTEMWCMDMLFVSPEQLKKGGRKQLKEGTQTAEGIWFFLEGTWVEIPKDECKALCKGFVKQGCYNGMGWHYFYKLSNESTFVCENMVSAVVIYEDGQLVGANSLAFGSFTSLNRTWFDVVPSTVVEKFLPNKHKCVLESLTNYGILSMHMSFKPDPRSISCESPHQDPNRCLNYKCS